MKIEAEYKSDFDQLNLKEIIGYKVVDYSKGYWETVFRGTWRECYDYLDNLGTFDFNGICL